MSEIQVIQGEIYSDERGSIMSLNDFHFNDVRRTYVIKHPDSSVIRGWHGHQFERKWFFCLKGSFTVALVKIDDWEDPSSDLIPEVYQLSENDSKIVCVPAGYANCLKTNEPGSIIQVFSDKILDEAVLDSWRYPKDMWIDWNIYK